MSETLLVAAARAATAGLDQGRSEDDIVSELTGMGLSDVDARGVIDRIRFARNTAGDEASVARRLGEGYRQQMFTGAIVLIAAIAFTLWSASSSRGGVVWVAWGGMLFGLVWLIQGFFGWLKHA